MSQAYTTLDDCKAFSSAFEKFANMVATLHDAPAQHFDHGQVERFLETSGRELLRRMFQGYLDYRAATEPDWESLEGNDAIIRNHRRQDCQRHLVTLFGEVIVSRTSYGARGVESRFVLDAQLNLPPDKYSDGLRRRLAGDVALMSFDEATAQLDQTSGGHIPKRQSEQVVVKVAQDFEAFYDMRRADEPEAREDFVILTTDAKGIVMHQEDLREGTRRAAQRAKSTGGSGLSPGKQDNRKRMAQVASVYSVAPYVRRPEALMNPPPDQDTPLRPQVENKRVWASVERDTQQVIDDIFDEALRRDPQRQRQWVVLIADLDSIEAGLTAVGIRIRPSKYDLKTRDPKKGRQYLIGLWRRHQHQPEVGKLYQSKLILAQQLISKFVARHPNRMLPVTFDNWYTQPAFCRFLDKTLKVPYVGTLARDNLLTLKTGQQRLDTFDAHLKQAHQQSMKCGGEPVFRKLSITYKGGKETYYSYCKTHHIHNFGKHRLVINHRQADLSDSAAYFISNQLKWQAGGITRIRRPRWPVEVYHEEGKVDGLDQDQLRDFQAILRHIALVAVTYSLLRAAQHDKTLLHKLQRQVQTQLDGSAGCWRRNTQAQALWTLATLIATGLSQGQTLQDVMDPLLAVFAY